MNCKMTCSENPVRNSDDGFQLEIIRVPFTVLAFVSGISLGSPLVEAQSRHRSELAVAANQSSDSLSV